MGEIGAMSNFSMDIGKFLYSSKLQYGKNGGIETEIVIKSVVDLNFRHTNQRPGQTKSPLTSNRLIGFPASFHEEAFDQDFGASTDH